MRPTNFVAGLVFAAVACTLPDVRVRPADSEQSEVTTQQRSSGDDRADAGMKAASTASTAGVGSATPKAMSTPGAPGAMLGKQGAAGSGGDNARQSLIDAAIEALGGGNYPWRGGGMDGDGLSADFVKSILFSLVASGTCFRDTRRCVQTCFVIASDCKPCAADPECAEALKTVCGPLGSCSP